MISNHLLIYRLAELMFEHEQHILPVDLLFDDEQIGDYVKSIQIDSPYQQMLLDGVLTESVWVEKLYVSYTVEGYFHFVLGEVIFNKTKRTTPDSLTDILENNQLKGITEGIQYCLLRDVYFNDLSRLKWLINSGIGNNSICAVPLANSFFFIRIKTNSDAEYLKAIKEQIFIVINELNLIHAKNQIHALEFAINYLNKLQKNELVSILYAIINNEIIPNNLHSASLYLKSLNHMPKSLLVSQISTLEDFKFENDGSARFALFLRRLGQLYSSKNVANFDKAIVFFKKALEIDLDRYPNSYIEVSVNYSMIGMAYLAKGDIVNANQSYQKTLSTLSENNHHDLSTVFELLGLLELKRENYILALGYFDRALKIKTKIFGKYHSEVHSTTSAIAHIQEKLYQLNDR